MKAAARAIRAPALAKGLERAEVDALDGLEIEKCRVEGAALAKQRAGRVRLDGVHLVRPALGEARASDLAWTDVLCERGDLSMIEWPAARLNGVELRDCRLTGAKLAEAEFDHVRFVDCRLDYAVFSEARFRHVVFERCRFDEADLTGADLSGTVFTDCTLRAVDFTGAKLQGADVGSSTLTEVRVSPADVRGLVVSREQAAVLAQLFGLVLRDA